MAWEVHTDSKFGSGGLGRKRNSRCPATPSLISPTRIRHRVGRGASPPCRRASRGISTRTSSTLRLFLELTLRWIGAVPPLQRLHAPRRLLYRRPPRRRGRRGAQRLFARTKQRQETWLTLIRKRRRTTPGLRFRRRCMRRWVFNHVRQAQPTPVPSTCARRRGARCRSRRPARKRPRARRARLPTEMRCRLRSEASQPASCGASLDA